MCPLLGEPLSTSISTLAHWEAARGKIGRVTPKEPGNRAGTPNVSWVLLYPRTLNGCGHPAMEWGADIGPEPPDPECYVLPFLFFF